MLDANAYWEAIERANERGESLDFEETQPPDAGLSSDAPLEAERPSPPRRRKVTRTARRIKRREAASPYAPRPRR
jgi:hypothetical protein